MSCSYGKMRQQTLNKEIKQNVVQYVTVSNECSQVCTRRVWWRTNVHKYVMSAEVSS